jgi:hypothetical protein
MTTRQYGSPTQYIGRVFDLLALQGAVRVGEAQLQQTIFGTDSSGEVCTGVQKLAQRWTLKFLTEAGSMTYLPNEGTGFVESVRTGQLHNETDVQSAFIIAAVQVRISMLAEENSSMNDEDRMGNATLKSLSISDDWISLTVDIASLAGVSREIILPIPYLPIATGVA